jgi:hypothetical protein
VTEATTSNGSKIHVSNGDEPLTFTAIAEVRDWTYGKVSATEEATSHDSLGHREHVHTIFEQPDVTFEVNWIAGEETHERLEAIQAGKRAVPFRFFDVDEDGEEIDGIQVDCLVTAVNRARPAVGIKRNSITLKPTGAPAPVAGS